MILGKFQKNWANQTDLGKAFGLSAIAVGKELIAHGLKDPATKLATKRATTEGFATATPLKDGTPFFMWNIQRVKSILRKQHEELSKVDWWVQEVLGQLAEADRYMDEGRDKAGIIWADCAFEKVPKEILAEVTCKVEAKRA